MDSEFDRDTEQFVLLCEPENDRQRDLLLGMLKEEHIPAFSRDNGAGAYVRIVTGGSVFGSKVFVPISCQSQAAQLWASVERKDQPEFSYMELNAAYEDYMRSHIGEETDGEQPAGTKNGYRTFWYFLVGFGALIAAALILIAVTKI